jgi:hypothetical protein
MFCWSSIAGIVCALTLSIVSARAEDLLRYPDWSGLWRRAEGGPIRYDPSKGQTAQEIPLTTEYQAIYEASVKDLAEGGQGNNVHAVCVPSGMPRVMTANQPIEFVVTPKITYINFTGEMPRRIYTDGRRWPEEEEPSFSGYSLGKWIDDDGGRRLDVLEIETRHMKGPRTFDGYGNPLHEDNQTIVKERIYLDKVDAEILHDDITTIDHALTRPYTVNKTYRRLADTRWIENICSVGNNYVLIGTEIYMLRADGLLMPIKKGQKPPDLRYFDQPPK